MWDNPPTTCPPTIPSHVWGSVGAVIVKVSVPSLSWKKLILRQSPPHPLIPPLGSIIARMVCCSGDCGVVFTFWLPLLLPQHTHTHTHAHTDIHTHFLPPSAPSVPPSAATQHQSACSASRQHLGNLFSPSLPPSLPLCHLSLSPASLFSTIHAYLGWVSESVLQGEGHGEENGDHRQTDKREQGHKRSAACRPLQTWPRRRAPGAAGRARVLTCLLCWSHSSIVCVCCGCERCIYPACGLHVHETIGFVVLCVCVLFICYVIVIVKCRSIKQQCVPAPPITQTRPDDRTFLLHVCVCVCLRKTKRWETLGAVLENELIHTSLLRAICFGCMLTWTPVLWTKACHCYRPPHICSRADFIWRMLCFCVMRQSQHPDGTDTLSPW